MGFGFNIGRFFVSWSVNDGFCGISFDIGWNDNLQCFCTSIQFGWALLMIGVDC